MRLLAALVPLALLVGCGQGQYDCPAYDDDWCGATDLVWINAYRMPAELKPAVDWKYQEDLNCADGLGWIAVDICVAGQYWRATNYTLVSRPDVWAPHQSAISHELCHAKQYLLTGDSDTNHVGQCFVPGGDSDLADEYLASVGL